MKNYTEFPLDPNQGEAEPGGFMVCLDGEEGKDQHMRLHIKLRGGYAGYNYADFETLESTHDASKARVYQKHDYFTRLEPIMNLLGARKKDGYAACVIVTREELENILRG